MKKNTQSPSVIKTLITVKANLQNQPLTDLNRLLLKIERAMGSVGFTTVAGNTLIWQIYADSYDSDFWSTISLGNDLEVYVQQIDRVW